MKKTLLMIAGRPALLAILFSFTLLTTSLQSVAADGTGVVTVTANGGSCVGFTAASGSGPDNWEVAEGGSYTMTITGVTECSGNTITVFVQNSNNGNFCFNATGSGGTYVGVFTMPNPSCFTSPISYKCGESQSCDNADTYNADGPSNNNKVHLRASYFNGNCEKTDTDEDCSGTSCAISASGSDLDVSCFGANNGSIDITVSGAQGAVTFEWSDGATTEDRTGLAPGNYSVTVTDEEGCTATESYTISEPALLETSGVKVDESSAIGSDGSIDVTVSGGTSPYSYLWNDGATDEDRTNLAAGTYTVTVTDANGCSDEASFEIEEYVCTINVDAGTDTDKCHNEPTMLTAMSSDPNATFSWAPAGDLDNPNSANPVTNVKETTTYTVTATGADGCVATDEVTVTVYALVKAKISVKPNTNSCQAPCVKLFTPNNPDYSFEWRNNGLPIAGAADKNTYCACESGLYSVHVTNVATGCAHTSKKYELVIAPKLEAGELVSANNGLAFNAWPNPTADNVNITLANSVEGDVEVQVLDLFGRQIKVAAMNGVQANQTITFNMNEFASGMYVVRIVSGAESSEQKVMLIK